MKELAKVLDNTIVLIFGFSYLFVYIFGIYLAKGFWETFLIVFSFGLGSVYLVIDYLFKLGIFPTVV